MIPDILGGPSVIIKVLGSWRQEGQSPRRMEQWRHPWGVPSQRTWAASRSWKRPGTGRKGGADTCEAPQVLLASALYGNAFVLLKVQVRGHGSQQP